MLEVSKFKQEYIVKSYETDCHGFLRLLTLMNLLQDMAVTHADILGFGFEECRKRGVLWVGANYVLNIARWPQMNEKITIETWPSEEKMWGAIRDFAVKDEYGEVVIKASSLWVLVDTQRRRPVQLRKHFPDYEPIAEHALVTDFPKIPMVENVSMQNLFKVRFDDIDVNHHVNNAVFLLWASESLENEFRSSHYPSEIEIQFKKEVLYGSTIVVKTERHENESIHLISESQENSELAYCRIKWQQITSK